MTLMKDIREAILADHFPDFIREFMFQFFKNRWTDEPISETHKGQTMDESGYPSWIVNALQSVNVDLI